MEPINATLDLTVLKDVLVVLGAAGIVVPIARRFHISPVIGFLAAGVLMGPYGLSALTSYALFAISERETLAQIAEFGVVFLMFIIGLELSFARLITMRRLVFGLGGIQVCVCILVIALLARQFISGPAALVMAAGLALSSTAINVEILSAQKRMATTIGRTCLSILIFQDLAVIPTLFLLGAFGDNDEPSILLGLGYAAFSAVVTILAIAVAGKFLLRPLFRLVARPDTPELFIAAALFVVIGTGVLAAAAGLPMALGAFIAGLLLAETEYRRAIEASIEPFKGLLLGLFFFSVGLSLDVSAIKHYPLFVVSAVVSLVALKAMVIFWLCRLAKLSTGTALEAALLLAPAGEFAFVIFKLAAHLKILTAEQSTLAIVTASLSMALIPLLGMAGRRLSRRFEQAVPIAPQALEPPPEDRQRRAIVVGFGRVGQLVAEMLAVHQVAYLAIDSNAKSVARKRDQNMPVYWGDATNPAFLRRCGIMEASAIVVTVHDPKQIEAVVTAARTLRPDVVIVARTPDAGHASRLYALGVTDAVPETIEASLQLSEAALAGLGIPTGRVIASIHERRDLFRAELQQAAGRATHAIKPSSSAGS